MSDSRPYLAPSTSSSSQKRSYGLQQQTNYEVLLSQFNSKQNGPKNQKSQSAFQPDKYYIQSLQNQITELKEEVQYLKSENNRLKNVYDKSLDKINQQYQQLMKYSSILQQLKELKVENIALKQNVKSLKIDFTIQILPLKQILKQFLQIPKINEIMQIRLDQQDSKISMLQMKSEFLNLERASLLDTCYQFEEQIIKLKSEHI